MQKEDAIEIVVEAGDEIAVPDQEVPAEIVPFTFEGTPCRTLFDTRTQKGYICLADLLKAQGTSSRPHHVLPEIEEVFGDEGKIVTPVRDTLGRLQKTLFVIEHAAAFVISRGRTAASKRFNRWLFGEVFPSIRKTGQYAMGSAEEREKLRKISEALLLAGEVIEDQKKEIENQRAIIEAQGRRIAEDAPKVEFHDAMFAEACGVTVTEAARACSMSGAVLLRKLVEEGVLQREERLKKNGERMGYQYSVIDEAWKGYLVVQTRASSVGAATFVRRQVRVTEAGVEMLKRRYQ